MAATTGQTPGPLRPIPIHCARPPGLDTLRFRLPLSLETPKRPNPPLWNPALDLCSTSREKVATSESDVVRKPKSHSKRSLSSTPQSTLAFTAPASDIQSSAMEPSESSPKTIKLPKTFTPSLDGSPNPQPVMTSALYHHLYRQFPNCLENPLAVLAMLRTPENMLTHPTHPAITAVPNLALALSERQIALQNALSFAQSRAVMERINSSHPHVPRGTVGQLQQSQSLHHHHSPQNPQQLNPNPQLAISNIRQSVPHSERLIPLQNTNTPTHSRALLERINNNPILSPTISLDAAAHGYGRKLFPCPQCRYTTDRRNNLKRHMLTMHQTSSKMLECCGVLFSTKASLREHAMIFHYHGYTCYFCGRRFCRKALLKRHLSVHNGQKDFVCTVCDYATSHKSNLERHRKVHSRQDDGKDGEDGQQYHDDIKSNGSEALSQDDVSSDDLSVCSDYDDDIDVEINVHSD